ncbi:MAG: methyltransferase protein [Chloroflexi bacterium]|nr:methyltransferase protein [Chloroflexota bacterium]
MLICPHCSAMLARDGATYRCENGHAFDVAREGYVNLLRTRSTGDSAEMLRARRAFLERSHYAPLAEAVCEVVDTHLREMPTAGTMGNARTSILDSGCGEGYYLGRLHDYLAAQQGAERYRLWGLDSSKDAIRMAAKRYREMDFVVADCKDMIPFANGSIAALMDIFAPRNPAEFARVLAPGGLLLIVVPSPNHLGELREALDLLGMEENKLRNVQDSLRGIFSKPEVRPLEYTMDLTAEDVALLVTMTPSHRHSPEQRLAALRPDERYRATAAFTLVACTRV